MPRLEPWLLLVSQPRVWRCAHAFSSSAFGLRTAARYVVRGREFTRVENGTEQTDTRYYHHFENGACYEFVLAVAESPDNKTAVDHFELFDNLERIMASVEIKSGAPASVTASVPGTPTNDSKPQQ